MGYKRRNRDTSAITLAPHRVAAMVLRYLYLLRSSWPRVLELVYWPAVQLLVWGFLHMYIAQNAGFFARAGGVFIGAVMMWDILFRGQLGFSISFLEEMWSRNLGNLMISPLRPFEFVCALMIMSIVRLAIGMIPVSLLAIAFFGFNVWGMGLALAVFFLTIEGRANRPEQQLVVKWLFQKVRSAVFHGFDRKRNIAVPGNDDHRNGVCHPLQSLQQVDATEPRHADIGDDGPGIEVRQRFEE